VSGNLCVPRIGKLSEDARLSRKDNVEGVDVLDACVTRENPRIVGCLSAPRCERAYVTAKILQRKKSFRLIFPDFDTATSRIGGARIVVA
jgi:hypothetical protein